MSDEKTTVDEQDEPDEQVEDLELIEGADNVVGGGILPPHKSLSGGEQ